MSDRKGPPLRRKGWQWFDVSALLAAAESIEAPLVSVRRSGCSRSMLMATLRQLDGYVAVNDAPGVVELWTEAKAREVKARGFGVPLGVAPCGEPVAAPAKKSAKPKAKRRGRALLGPSPVKND